MKSYSVKSNAKRFARGVAAKYPGNVEAAEPVEISSGAGEWFAAVSVIDGSDETCAKVVADFPDAVYIYGYTDDVAGEDVATAMAEGDAGVYSNPVEDMSEPTAPAEPLIFDAATIARRPELSSIDLPGIPKPVTPETLAKAAASLPPPVRSSREEIDARRAQRRQRIDAEKADGTRDAGGSKKKPEKINKKKIIIDLLKREGGATQGELEDATGWQRHTLRGYIAGTLRKQVGAVGYEIRCIRGTGDIPTRYAFAKRKPVEDAA